MPKFSIHDQIQKLGKHVSTKSSHHLWYLFPRFWDKWPKMFRINKLSKTVKALTSICKIKTTNIPLPSTHRERCIYILNLNSNTINNLPWRLFSCCNHYHISNILSRKRGGLSGIGDTCPTYFDKNYSRNSVLNVSSFRHRSLNKKLDMSNYDGN